MDLLIGIFGGWILRMAYDKHSREKAAEAQGEAYRERCDAQRLRDEAARLSEQAALDRKQERMAAEFVEKMLLFETREYQR